MISSENALLLIRGWLDGKAKVRASLTLDDNTRAVVTGFIASMEDSTLVINDGKESGMTVDLAGAKFAYSNDRDIEAASLESGDPVSDMLRVRLCCGLHFFLLVLR